MKRPQPQYPIDEKVARRLDRLALLIDEQYEHSPKVFQERTGIKMAQVSQWFTGYRALRDKALKRLEQATGKPAGWFDGEAPDLLANWPFSDELQEAVSALEPPELVDLENSIRMYLRLPRLDEPRARDIIDDIPANYSMTEEQRKGVGKPRR